MKNKFLSEGIIKVPSIVLNESIEIVSNVLLQTLYDTMKNYITDKEIQIVIKNLPEFKKFKKDKYDGLTLNENASVVSYASKLNQHEYSYKYHGKKFPELKTGAVYAPSRTLYGFYIPEHNLVGINLAQYSHFNKTVKNLENIANYMSGDYNEEEFELFYDEYFFRKLNNNIKNIMDSIPATLEHELAHFIQNTFLNYSFSTKQNTSDYNEYINSIDEFNPHVISIVNTMKKSIDKLVDYDVKIDKKQFNFLIKLILGISTEQENSNNRNLTQYGPYLTNMRLKRIFNSFESKNRKIALKYIYDNIYRYSKNKIFE